MGRFLILCICLLVASCSRKKTLNRNLSLWRMDKIPYGTKYAFDNLPFIFPDADISTDREFPDLSLEEKDDTAEGADHPGHKISCRNRIRNEFNHPVCGFGKPGFYLGTLHQRYRLEYAASQN